MIGSDSNDLGVGGVNGEINESGFGLRMDRIRGFEVFQGGVGGFAGAAVHVNSSGSGNGGGGGDSSMLGIGNWDENVGGVDCDDLMIDASDLGLDSLETDMMTMDTLSNDVNGRDEEKNEKAVQFLPSDLVWGKVKSHPWWPGQIFEPWDASEIAKKHFKPNSYLVAYFGDQSFAWNEEAKLKPFWPYFSQMAKQSTAGGFLYALDGAFKEAYRRVEFAMSCHCIDENTYRRIRTQIVESDGIRKEFSVREGGDRFFTASSFEPVKFVPYVKALALLPDVELDRLEVVMAGALLSAFYRWKGYYTMAKFYEPSQLFKNEADGSSLIEKETDFIVEEGSDIKVEKGGRRRVGQTSSTNGRERKPSESLNGTSEYKVKRRMRGSNLDTEVKVEQSQGTITAPSIEHCSPFEMLLQLQMAANDPTIIYSSLSSVVFFFSYFRNSVAHHGQFYGDMVKEMLGSKSMEKSISAEVTEDSEGSNALRKSKRKRTVNSKYIGFSADGFEDSYWTDRIITFPLEEPFPADDNVIITTTNAPIPNGAPSTLPAGRSDGDTQSGGGKEGTSPTAMILNFSDPDSIPVAEELNVIFRQYGSLLESETEVLRKSSCAKVVFRRKSDAENAFRSSGKFKAFGPSLSSYRLNYDPILGNASAGRPSEVD